MQLLVRGGVVITMRADHAAVATDIAIVDGRIAALGSATDLELRFGPPHDTLDARGRHVLPGLVNAHTHTFQSAFRGLGDGFALRDWQRRLTQPAYGHITAEDAYWFTLLGCVENLRTGVTTIVNFQAFPNDLDACRLVAQGATLVQRVTRHDAAVLPPGVVLDMATRGGAVAAGVDAGSIEPGRLGDLCVVELSGVHDQPLHRPISALVHSARPEDVVSVVVAGRVVLRERKVTTVDEAQITSEAASRARRVVARSGLIENVHRGWPWE